MRTPFRFISVVAALAAGSLGLTACDASPYAATVNGHVITVNEFNHQLSTWTSNKAFVQALSQRGNTVTGTGGPGTYSTKFASELLTVLVGADIVHQHLAAAGTPATAEEMVASRAVNQVLYAQVWEQFAPSVRDFLVQQQADLGVLAQIPADLTQVDSGYQQIQQYLFSSVCVIQASAFSSDAAQAIVSSGTVTGAETCYDQADLEALSPALQTAVENLAQPGDISQPVKTSYGFVVLKLVNRSTPGLSPAVEQVLASVSNPPDLTAITSGAKVHVNPVYGTWSGSQVIPPVSPLAPPTTSSNATPPGS